MVWRIVVGVVATVVWVGGVVGAEVRMEDREGSVRVAEGERVVMEYRYGGVPFKPYVRQLSSPKGINVLRDAPGDHLHHHALMFAIAAEGVDFWAETANCGKQVHREMVSARASAVNEGWRAEMVEKLDWVDGKGEAILNGERTVEVRRMEGVEATVLSWRETLWPAKERKTAKLTGSHYYGLGMRFVESMDKTGTWIYPEKKSEAVVVRTDEKLVYANWCAYTAKAEGKEVTVAMFDDPGNVRPARWFTMQQQFAYMAGTINLWKEAMTIENERPLKVRYGVAVWDGAVEAGEIERVYGRWVEGVGRK